MSGIAGSFNTDGAPADPLLLTKMLRQIAMRGLDGSSTWIEGAVALGHAMLRTTPQAHFEHLPFHDARRRLVITLHGRLDNRGELVGLLRPEAAALATDSQLVLLAYERWGNACPTRLIGDFAFAIWNEAERMLFCARDPFGHKPLFFARAGASLLFASEPRALLEAPRLDARANEGVAAEFLLGGARSMQETLLEDVRRLPPAHCLIVTAEGMRIERYWDFDLTREVRHGSQAEYAEHFLEIFREAVASCLRADRAVGVMLSGGLDSTSIVSIAQEMRAVVAPLQCFSMSFPGTLCDESDLVAAVAAATGCASTLVPWRREDPSYFAARARSSLDFPGYPNSDGVYAPLEALAGSAGIRVLLTGIGGDEGLSGSLYHYADMLRGLRFGALLSQLRADRELLGGDQRLAPVVHTELMLLRQGLFPLVPQSWRWSVKRLLRRHVPLPGWVRPEFAARVDLAERMRPRSDARGAGSFAQRAMAEVLCRPASIHEAELLERLSAAHGIELRNPFMDRRLLEFALALPEDQRWHGERTKVVLREAMRGHLPPAIVTRRTKADFSHMVAETLCELTAQGFWRHLESDRRGWVDGAALACDARRLEMQYRAGGDEYTRDFWPLWMAAGVEFWLRGVCEWHALGET